MQKVNNKKATRFSRRNIVKNRKQLNKHFFAGGKCLLNTLNESPLAIRRIWGAYCNKVVLRCSNTCTACHGIPLFVGNIFGCIYEEG